ncbi:MAG: stage III sporulation AC/AD family protein [Ruminococcus sp.]|nr:stage III sporulation AC/AD family protein [Ruminococcus sp.]MCD7800702.1 stage III sporulation AC/AD family protein [Ruminococcus sp.]
MINIISVCGLVVCVVILNKLLENYSKEYIILISIGASILILIYLSSYITSVLDFLNQLLTTLGDNNDIYTLLLKSLGICIVTNFAIDICKDANQNALSSVVLIVGKVSMLLLSIPLLQELFNVITNLIYRG